MNTKLLITGDIVTIPVSFGHLVGGKAKRVRTGFVQAEFVERIDDDTVRVRFGDGIYVVSDGQLV
jgi:hypothetical protein